MNPVLNSNASSALVSVLDKVDTQHNPFEYKYGKNENVTYQNHTNGVECSNSIFGDPAPNIFKECHYQIIVDTSPITFDTDGDTFGDGFEICLRIFLK